MIELKPDLTPDQQQVFERSRNWSDFRALFPTEEEAIAAHIHAAQGPIPPSTPITHQLEWRLIYHDNASKRRQLFLLLFVLFGYVATSHAERRFTTFHTFSATEARQIQLGRALGSLCYHLCFIALILTGVVLVITLFMVVLAATDNRFNATTIIAMLAAGVGFAAALWAAAKSRSIGLSASLRPIAKDAFDLLSVKTINAARPT